jgi:hypothetical protein
MAPLSFFKVPPGTYTVIPSGVGPWPSPNIVVAETDVTMVAIFGAVIIDGDAPASFSFSLQPVEPSRAAPNTFGVSGRTFQAFIQEGLYRLAISKLDRRYSVQRVTAEDVELLKDPLKISSESDSITITVELRLIP